MKKRYVFFSAAIITFLFLLLLCLLIPSVEILSIYARKNPTQRFYHKTAELNDFVISYTHSVNKGRVHDYYKFGNNGILIMDHTEFVSYGAGIPEPEETPGAIFSAQGDTYLISGIERKLEKLVMAVGVIANHTIRFDLNDFGPGVEIPLSNYFAPQTSLIFETKKVSVLDYFSHKL